jgi:hypothetical protein
MYFIPIVLWYALFNRVNNSNFSTEIVTTYIVATIISVAVGMFAAFLFYDLMKKIPFFKNLDSNAPKIRFSATSKGFVLNVAASYLNDGYIITRSFKRKSLIRKQMKYYVVMGQGVRNYQKEISVAVSEDRYEDAAKLKDQYSDGNDILREQYERQTREQTDIINNLFV